jgi:hypothetical protein
MLVAGVLDVLKLVDLVNLVIKKVKENKMAKKFKPHPMYKDCKVKMAFKKEDHDKLKAKGYDHKKDPSCKKKK